MDKSQNSGPTASGTLSHLTPSGEAHMVDVSDKQSTVRIANAQARVVMSAEAFAALQAGNNKKGDVLAVARIAGIQAAKQTAQLIPLCHPLPLSKVSVDFKLDEAACEVLVDTHCKTQSVTGVEMEALTAASVAALTIYDMCKAVDKGMQITDLCLLNKSGGKSGDWRR